MRVVRIAGLTATPSTQKGPGDEIIRGEIWIADLTTNRRSRLTNDDVYRSPIFLAGDQIILALREDEIVQIPVAGGQARKLFNIRSITKLVGATLDDSETVLVLTQNTDQRPSVGLISLKSGQLSPIPFDESSREDRRILVHLQGWERVYGDTKLYLKSETKGGLAGSTEWIDVYLKRDHIEPINISNCEGRKCGQPSLSQGKKLVVYIKATE